MAKPHLALKPQINPYTSYRTEKILSVLDARHGELAAGIRMWAGGAPRAYSIGGTDVQDELAL